jgi:hypothetical protein
LVSEFDALAAPFVWREVGGMNPSDPVIVSYRKAIHAMQTLPATNPLSWAYQAAIDVTQLTLGLTAWNTCEHGTYFFWSWHRMYLYWFERIIRKMAPDPCWALPYWNYESASERQLPVMFRDTTSELYTPHRVSAMNDGSGSLPASHVDPSAGLALINFTDASSSIEGTPHNVVHGNEGGWSGWMGNIQTAAQDPIFYLHDANIDRLWDLWLAQGGGCGDPLADSTWKNRKYIFFDVNGHQLQMSACQILRAAQQLDYVYEGEPPQVNEYCLPIIRPPIIFERVMLIHFPIPPVVLTGERVSFSVDLRELHERVASIVESKTETLFLELDDVEAERHPGVVWEVYVGLPENASPDPKRPFYVGNIALFGPGIRNPTRGEFRPAHFAFPINRAVSAALKAGRTRLLVTFLPSGILIHGRPSRSEAKFPVRIGRASLVVETEKRREGKQ